MENKLRKAEEWYDRNKFLYEKFSKEMCEIITKILKNENVLYQSVSYRIKEKESYINKCKKEKYSNPIEQILDVAGIRIIAYTNQDVMKICKILEEEFLIDKDNSINKAKILETDKVGYLSVHYILQLNEKRLDLAEYAEYKELKCEVQVRTLLQHAWAEIEHDRNYKFTGVLPNDIKRRFHLVAGVLEMMDSEFDKLSRDIEEYTNTMKEAVEEGNYDLEIDSKSLEQYVLNKFAGMENIQPSNGDEIVSEEIIEELLKFGYKTIQDVEDDFNSIVSFTEILSEKETTYIGVLRSLMIVTDCAKYFDAAYQGYWQRTEKISVQMWKKYGATNVEHYLNRHSIEIV